MQFEMMEPFLKSVIRQEKKEEQNKQRCGISSWSKKGKHHNSGKMLYSLPYCTRSRQPLTVMRYVKSFYFSAYHRWWVTDRQSGPKKPSVTIRKHFHSGTLDKRN